MTNAPVTAEELRRSARQTLAAAGIESADIDTKILIREAFGWDASDVIAKANQQIPEDGLDCFEILLARRIKHEPIAYIVGMQPFWSLEFIVTPDVLIPRPETEGLVESALELIKDIDAPVIIDIGAGSGAILLSLLHERTDANGIGLDISVDTLDIAKQNAEHLNLADRVEFVRSDYLSVFTGKADLIVSNPPYITDQAMNELPLTVADFEPELALRGGREGMIAYWAIIADLARVLVPGGYIVFEIGYDQGQAVAALLTQNGFENVRVEQDLAGHDRVVSGKLSV